MLSESRLHYNRNFVNNRSNGDLLFSHRIQPFTSKLEKGNDFKVTIPLILFN